MKMCRLTIRQNVYFDSFFSVLYFLVLTYKLDLWLNTIALY